MWINSSVISVKENNWLSTLRSFIFIAIGFSIPLSTAAISITFVLVFALWLLDGNYLAKWNMIRHNPVYISIIAFFLLHLLGFLWLEAPEPKNGFKSWMIFLIPVLATAVDAKTARRGLYAFFVAMLISEFWVYSNIFNNWDSYINLKSFKHFDLLVEKRFYISGSRVTYNPLLAFAIAILLGGVLAGRYRSWGLFWGVVLLITMVANMFMTEGRSGYLAFLCVWIVLSFYFFSKRWLALFVMLLGLVLIVVVAFNFSPRFIDRVEKASGNLDNFQTVIDNNSQLNTNRTSVGLRLHFAKTALSGFLDRPWLGYGTGSYEYMWNKQAEKHPGLVMPVNTNPHNHHILILVQFGLLGTLVYGAIYASQLWLFRAMPITYDFRSLALLLPLFYGLMNFFDTSFWGHQMQALFAYATSIIYRSDMWGEMR